MILPLGTCWMPLDKRLTLVFYLQYSMCPQMLVNPCIIHRIVNSFLIQYWTILWIHNSSLNFLAGGLMNLVLFLLKMLFLFENEGVMSYWTACMHFLYPRTMDDLMERVYGPHSQKLGISPRSPEESSLMIVMPSR